MLFLKSILITCFGKSTQFELDKEINRALEKAELLFIQKEYEKSNGICNLLLSKGFRLSDLLHLKGLNCIHLNDFSEAIEYLHQSLVYDPKDSKKWVDMGFACTRVNDLERGLEAFQNGLKISPNSSSACNGIGVILAKQGSQNEAIKMFQLAVKYNPNNQTANRNLSKLTTLTHVN